MAQNKDKKDNTSEEEKFDASHNDEGYNEQAQKFNDGKSHDKKDAIEAVHRKDYAPQNFDDDPREK